MPTATYSRADAASEGNTAIYPSHIQKQPKPPDFAEKEQVQLTDIVTFTDNDVLCGRGGAVLRHPGNVQYQNIIKQRQPEYTTCLKAEKLHISRSIVERVRFEHNGRFLGRDSSSRWNDIGDKKAIEKTSQALREGQPKRWETMLKAKARAKAGNVLKGIGRINHPKDSSSTDDNASTSVRSTNSDDGTVSSLEVGPNPFF
eukprot:CAMPEP_0197830296 /NCGR_PEP_ID=MMETSP1437-20131217/6893_1 /TAXON_ID=49252 ORGANISM="Eucampia antarctica, Strain CCMP1452" /NCGR_SAMPLE_ID=MMETSP1437 /ASSEMBLY_ACC=CAM_ASM_001096 /LENGTH=200 /DNA_ID=CAMNT_0043432591 /DNA_START=286 /DNA_END=889 /DNA_ORIENTATION=+